jgi:hypothetical protein
MIFSVPEEVINLCFFADEIRKKWRNGLTPRKMHG